VNVGTYLLLTVPIVGGSILLYDNLRGSSAPAESAPISAPAPRTTASEPAPGPVLEGDRGAEIDRRVRAAVELALRDVPSRPAGSTGVVPGTDGNGGTLPTVAPLELSGDAELLAGPNAQFDERTLKVFRAYLDEAQRLERVERQTEMITRQLDGLGVALSDTQKKAVVDATMKHQAQIRETFRALPGGAEARDARQKAVTDLRETYTKTIYDLVPVSEAEKIVKGLGGGAWRGGGFPDGGGARPRPNPAGGGDR
jgi:hypothetical protein